MQTRKTIRLSGYNYSSSGFYFITFNTLDFNPHLSRVTQDGVALTPLGERCRDLLGSLPPTLSDMEIDTCIMMPDHIHMIIAIHHGEGTRSIGDLLRWFKSETSKSFKRFGGHGALWQRGSYDVIIRSEEQLARIRAYIMENPTRWLERHTSPGYGPAQVGAMSSVSSKNAPADAVGPSPNGEQT